MNDVLIQWDIVNGVRVLVASKRNYKVVHDNKANGSSSLSETALSKNRLINQNSAITNYHLNNNPPTTSHQLNAIRSKHVIPSKDKSQQQHLSSSPNNQSSSYKRDESSKTKDKNHQSKHSEFTDLFGTPIKTKCSSKESNVKSKKSKSSSEKSSNSRSSTPTSICNQVGKELSKANKKSKDGKLNKSNASNSSSSSQSKSILVKDDELSIFKREKDDLPIDTISLSSKIKSPTSISSTNRFQELDRNNNHKYHSKKSNLLKSHLSSSSSSVNSYYNHQSRTNTKVNKKRKKQSNSASSESAKSTHSISSSSVASLLSMHSNQSRLSFSSNYSSSANRRNNLKKKTNNEGRYSSLKKKTKKETDNLNNKKEFSSNIAINRNLSSSLSSINSSADYKSKDDLKRKLKDNSKDNYFPKSSKSRQSPDSKFKTANLDEEELLRKKERKKENKKSKDEKKSSKKNKSKEHKDEKKHKTQSKQDLDSEKIVKEKNKDSMNKQTSHKENNLKKEATTSTKISFSNNNSTGTTTLEITSVKNVKMLQSESKKSKQHHDQSLNQCDKRSFKTSDKVKSHYSSPIINNRNYDNKTPTSSPCSMTDKFNPSGYNISKQEYMVKDEQMKRNQKLNNNYDKTIMDKRKNRKISPLSSDLNSEVEDFNLDDNEYGSNDESALKNNHFDERFDEKKKTKRKGKNASLLLGDESASDDDYRLHVEYVNELIHIQKQISELKDKELLSEIIDVVRESGRFEMNGTLFDFDLMKLDKTTIKKVKLCLP